MISLKVEYFFLTKLNKKCIVKMLTEKIIVVGSKYNWGKYALEAQE